MRPFQHRLFAAAFSVFSALTLCGAASAQDISRLAMTIDGKPVTVITHLYKPPGDGPFPVVLYLHGRPTTRRMGFPFPPVEREHGKFWVSRGVAVVAPVRPGYSPTGGDDGEVPFVPQQIEGGTHTRQTFATSTTSGTNVVMGALDWVRQQPWARKNKILIEGHSMGGLLAMTTTGRNPESVVGAISFAGGVGFWPDKPGQGREPEKLTPFIAEAGSKSKIPMLWISAPNDSFFGPEVVNTWFTAYKAGNADSVLLMTAPTAGDGHNLVNSNPEMWTSAVDALVAKTGFLTP
jgi:dienelactone hydrolase